MKLPPSTRMSRSTVVALFCLLAVALLSLGFLLQLDPIVYMFVLGVGAVLVLSFRPKYIIYAAVVLAVLLLRPNIWSTQLGMLGLAFFIVLGSGTLASTRFKSELGPALRVLIFVPLWLALAYGIMLFRAGMAGIDVTPMLVGGMGDVIVVASVLAFLSRRANWVIAVRFFVGLTVVFCLSYCVTLGLWGVAGFSAGQVATVPGAFLGEDVAVIFPFTPVISQLQVFGVTVPRFTGFGREPGWMAMYAGTAFLLFPYTGWKNKFARTSLVVGLLGTISTGGFAVFAVTIALGILTAAGGRHVLLQRAFGVVILAGGVYAALFAPVVGLASKQETNALSLTDRQLATESGLRALVTDPFSGGLASGDIPNVNLIASIAANGILYAIAISLAVLCVLAGHPQKAQLLPPIVGIFGTLLTTQPANGSSFIFCLVLVCAVATWSPLVTQVANPTLPKKGDRRTTSDLYPLAGSLESQLRRSRN